MYKFEKLLKSARRPEVLLKEIKVSKIHISLIRCFYICNL